MNATHHVHVLLVGARRFFAAAVAVAVLAVSLAAAPSLGVGAKLETLTVGKAVYQHVVVRSVSPRAIMISHDGGMASIPLRSLSAELQVAFGYSAAAEAASDAGLASAQAAQKAAQESKRQAQPKPADAPKGNSPVDALLRKLGQEPEIRASVDLRPDFKAMSLDVKNQGPRPSCAVFAVLGALEFHSSERSGKTERFSEEYLIWATSKLLKRPIRSRSLEADQPSDPDSLDTLDAGFTLTDVVRALHAYGVPLQQDLPYKYALNTSVTEPPVEVVQSAQNHNRIAVLPLPGESREARMANLVQALDQRIPVPIGLDWPFTRGIRNAFISAQSPSGRGHAVTVVGYENKTGNIKDTLFYVRNSWGLGWGAAGYGFITYQYLYFNMQEAVILDLAPEKKS